MSQEISEVIKESVLSRFFTYEETGSADKPQTSLVTAKAPQHNEQGEIQEGCNPQDVQA